MSKICIIRHGETDWNKKQKLQGRIDIELNETGIKQAKLLGKHFKNDKWNIVVSSPLRRAYQTAEQISNELSIKDILIEDDLVERDYGLASGLTKSEREKLYPEKNYPGIEDKKKLEERMVNCILNLSKKYKDKNILIISHGSAINTFLSKISNGKYENLSRLHNCSISTLEYKNNILEVIKYNEKIV